MALVCSSYSPWGAGPAEWGRPGKERHRGGKALGLQASLGCARDLAQKQKATKMENKKAVCTMNLTTSELRTGKLPAPGWLRKPVPGLPIWEGGGKGSCMNLEESCLQLTMGVGEVRSETHPEPPGRARKEDRPPNPHRCVPSPER